MPPRDNFLPTLDPAEALTRRRLLTMLPALGVIAAGVSCGDDEDTATPSAIATAGTRRIDTAMGSVDVPVAPRVIASIGYFSSYTLLDLGLTPAGVLDIPPTALAQIYAAKLQAIPKVGTNTEVDVEKVAALRPDLIIGENLDFEAKVYEQLQAIAPTALFTYKASGDWPTLAEDFAKVSGRTAELNEIKQRYTQRVDQLKAAYAQVLGADKWAVLNGAGTQATLFYPDSNNGRVLTALGITYGSAAAGKTGTFEQLAFEQLEKVDDCGVILYGIGSDGQPTAEQQVLLDQPTFKALSAVKAGHAFGLTTLFPTSYGAALILLDELEGVLKKLS